MSSDFVPTCRFTEELADISDKIYFDIVKGAANKTFFQQTANSQSSSGIQISVNPPSESTGVSRDIWIESTVSHTITIGPGLRAGDIAFDYGSQDCYQSFPLNRLFNTVTLSLNNVSTSVNSNQVIQPLVRLFDQKFMQERHGMSPTMVDNYGAYSDALATPNSPFSGYSQSGYDQYLLPRGAHPLSPLAADFTITRNGGALTNVVADDASTFTVVMKSTFREPILGLSPYIFGDASDKAAFLGVNNMQLNITINSSAPRLMSTTLPLVRDGAAIPYTISNVEFTDTKLLLNYLTAPISLVLPPKQVLPYQSYLAYVSQQNNAVAMAARVQGAAVATANFTANSIQFEVVPDKLIIYARERLDQQVARSADTFLAIENLNITFMNQSGLLSNAQPLDLYQMSRKNGLKCLDWNAFRGFSNVSLGVAPWQKQVPTAGSVVIIDPSKDLSVASPMLGNGSVGQFSFNVTARAANYLPRAINAELVVIAVRSGMIISTSGTSTLTTSMLNSNTVIQCLEKMSSKMPESSRVVGGARSAGAQSGGSSMNSRLSALSM